MDFSFKDAKKLWSFVWKQETLVEKKRRWLEMMIPDAGGCRKVKRPKFLNDVYLAESDIRSDEVSCEKVRAHVERSFRLQCDCYDHHLVQNGVQLANLQKEKDGLLSPESLKIMYSTVSKLNNGALESVANIVTSNRFSFNKTRPIMKKIIKASLPNHLANFNNDSNMSQLSQILRNPCSYQADSVSLVTPVSPLLLSSINQTLDELDEMPTQDLVAMNRKLKGKSCVPHFPHMARASKRKLIVEAVKKRCKKIISELKEGNDLPKNLGKAMSAINLSRKQKLRCMDISQSEFFPFPKKVLSLQNDVLYAIWSLPKVKHDELKLLRPILDPDSKVPIASFRIALRKYLTVFLFGCDEGNLPDEALQAIAFINRISRRQQVMLTEERKEADIDAVLNLSCRLKALTHCLLHDLGTEECSSDNLISLESENCSEENDFILPETNYFFNSDSGQRQMDGPCCSNDVANSADMRDFCSSETIRCSHSVPKSEDSYSESEEFLRKPCETTEVSGDAGDYNNNGKAAGTRMKPPLEKFEVANHLKPRGCADVDLYEISDETATVAHKLIGYMLDKFLLLENNEVDEFTRCYLGDGLVSRGLLDAKGLLNVAESPKSDVLAHAVENLLPSLPKSCIEKVKRLMS